MAKSPRAGPLGRRQLKPLYTLDHEWPCLNTPPKVAKTQELTSNYNKLLQTLTCHWCCKTGRKQLYPGGRRKRDIPRNKKNYLKSSIKSILNQLSNILNFLALIILYYVANSTHMVLILLDPGVGSYHVSIHLRQLHRRFRTKIVEPDDVVCAAGGEEHPP